MTSRSARLSNSKHEERNKHMKKGRKEKEMKER